MHFAPAGEVVARVLLLPPLLEEGRCAHRAINATARALARGGALTLVPDLTGVGNSRGRLAETTLEQWLADLGEAAACLADAPGPLILVGCRAGALLAVEAAATIAPARLVLWQPPMTGRGYLREAQVRRMAQDSITGGDKPQVGQYEVEGAELSPALHAALSALKLPAAKPAGDVRLVQCSFTEKLLTEYERLVAGWGSETVRVSCLVAEKFWLPHTPGEYVELAEAVAREVLA